MILKHKKNKLESYHIYYKITKSARKSLSNDLRADFFILQISTLFFCYQHLLYVDKAHSFHVNKVNSQQFVFP